MVSKDTYIVETPKTQLDCFCSHSVSGVINQINIYNAEHVDTPILKEDIVQIMKTDDTYILLYYK